jgi:uroporphyrin-III C-methyltransferase
MRATIGSTRAAANHPSRVASALPAAEIPRHNIRMTDSTPLPAHTWPTLDPGWVWLCGAGPGDPGLLTLHGLNALRQADVIVYDALVEPAILDWAPQALHEYAGKRGGKPSAKQRDISLRLVDLARAGKRVLRLKGGDPFVFGRGGEEAQTLVQHGIPIRIIPGISAGIGGLAYAGIPVTHRDVNQSVTFVTGHDQSGAAPSSLDWSAISKGSQVIVIYMGMKHIGRIAADLIAAGRPLSEPAAVVTSATTGAQQVLETTLGAIEADIAAAGIEPPSIICIGRSVLMRQALDWQAQALGTPPRDTDPLQRRRPAESA